MKTATTLSVTLLLAAYNLCRNNVDAFLPNNPSSFTVDSTSTRSLVQTKISFDEKEYDLFGKNRKGSSSSSSSSTSSGLVGVDIPLNKEDKGGDALSSLTSALKGEDEGNSEEGANMTGVDVDKEALLAELIFGTDDVREMIFRRIDDCGTPFIEFLDEKVDSSSDLEERAALRSLIDIIGSVQTAYDNFQKEEQVKAAEIKEKMAKDEAKLLAEIEERRVEAQAIEKEAAAKNKQQEAQKAKELDLQKSQREKQMKDIANAEQSYEQLLIAFLSLDYNDRKYVKEVVRTNYERCTIEFLNMMGDKMQDPLTDADDKGKMEKLQGLIGEILQEQMTEAATVLGQILQQGNMEAMETALEKAEEEGKITDGLILLMESNLQQAEKANATAAVSVFRSVIKRTKEIIDDRKFKDQPARSLIRKLLRIEAKEERGRLITEAFRPKKTTILPDGSKSAADPTVTPPDFIEETKQLILNFGNVDEGKFGEKLQLIAEEAGEIAISIYGQSLSVQDHQDLMWEKNTISVWDLGKIEEEGIKGGEEIPWGNDKMNDMMPPGFNPDGTRTIGGN